MASIETSEEAYRKALSVRAIRSYLPSPVPADVADKILEAGRRTGSSKNSQPWEFVVVREQASRQALARCGRFARPLAAAPLVVVLVRHPDGGDFDMGRLAQNMMLAAASLGIGSCPVTLHYEAKAREILGVPDTHGCRWAIAFGYPDEERRQGHRRPGKPARRPLGDLVHDERLGVRAE